MYSETFEVFSPKLFSGMRQSTTLTRHFASQGLKIKLRQDGTGRGGRRKKAQPVEPADSGPEPPPLKGTMPSEARPRTTPSQAMPMQDSQVSPTSNAFIPPYSAAPVSNPQPSGQRTSSSISSISYHLNPHGGSKDSSATRYSMSTTDCHHVPSTQHSTSTFSPRSTFFGAYLGAGQDGNHDSFGTRNDISKYSSDDNIQSIDATLDPQSNEADTQLGSRQPMHFFSSAMEVDLPKPWGPGTVSATEKGTTTLPSLNAAVQQSSVWLRNANLVPSDDLASGGIMFRNGIRYGGDDGSMPPMSFGKLPSLIYEGILPGTPGNSNGNGNDLSNFSLKNGSSNFTLTPYPLTNGSAPATPSISLHQDLTQFLANENTNGSKPMPRLEPSSRPDQSSRPYRPPIDIPGSARRPDTPSKPSQFADLDENPDAASVHDLAGFSSALSSSLENKVRNFNLALPRRISRESRGSRRSSDEQINQAQTVVNG